ncbi:MAG: hypothetical protein QM605_02950 [Sphingobium sp.]
MTVSQHSTAITTINGNVTTLFGRAALKVDVGGLITGWEINNNGTVGNMLFNANYFGWSVPGGGVGMSLDPNYGGTGKPRLLVDDGAGATVEIGWLP